MFFTYSKSAKQAEYIFKTLFPPSCNTSVMEIHHRARVLPHTLNAALDSCHVKWLQGIFYQSLMQLSHVSLEMNNLHNYWITHSIDGLLNNIPS